MAHLSKRIIYSLFLLLPLSSVCAQQLAFPEAAGFGRFATGGRNGSVYHVTNLNDSGTGSLRDAVSAKHRIIVFDVSGVIRLNSRLIFSSDIYVAGQTAPGEGIVVYGNGVSFSGANNIICRYMRFRMGTAGDNGKDCAGIANGTNMIFDHCSFAWGRDETFSINPDGKGDLNNITIQNCIVGQGLMSHSAGGLMQADNITLYRNFYCDNSTRNNKVKGKNQYANNVVYNWKDGAYIMGGDSEGQSYCNIQGNLFINGPSGNGDAFTGGNSNFHCYVKDNMQDKNKDGLYNPVQVTTFSGADLVATPYGYPTLDLVSASSLMDDLIPNVGASIPLRDYVDCYMIDELNSFGKSGALISDENSLIFGNPSTWNLWRGESRVDSDNDGMPDEWETKNGTDPLTNDAMIIASNKYTNIENYINSIIKDYKTIYLRKPMFVELASSTTSTITIKYRSWNLVPCDAVIEIKSAETGKFEAVECVSSTINNLQPGTAYTFRLKFKSDEISSDYSDEVTFKTRPLEVGVLDIDSYNYDILWKDNPQKWDFATSGWSSSDGLYKDNLNVMFRPEDSDCNMIDITETVCPKELVVDNAFDFTFNGSGNISGSTSFNKTGKGKLIMNNINSYTGATVVHDGIYSFNSLKNGGLNSGLGASQEFAQNWIFNGGTYEYTGSSVSTNRCARILQESALSVKSSLTTLSLNGIFEGNGNLILSGNGTFKPAKSFFGYTGSTILGGGTLYLSSAEISNAGIGSSSKLVFAGGTLKTVGETEGYETYSFPVKVQEGTYSYFSPNRNCYIKNTFTGSGDLQLNIPYVREYIQGNFDNFKGRLIAKANTDGNLFLLSGKNIPNAVVVLKNGAHACGWDTNGNYTLGGLSGDAASMLCGSSKKNDGFTCTWTIGGANTDETFYGSINNWSCSGSGHVGTVNIIKKGTGVWRISGNNDYKGTTNILSGNLVVNGKKSGTGAVSVGKNSTLSGLGSISGIVTVASEGEIFAGDTLLVNKTALTFNNKVTFSSKSIVTLPLYYNNETKKVNSISFKSGVAFNSAILNLEFVDQYETLDLPVGTSFQLFNISGTSTGSFSEIIPATPGVGKVWDTSKLVSKGVITVSTEEILSIDSYESTNLNSDIYDLKGRRITVPENSKSNNIVIKKNRKIYLDK